jgi:hypothetical protein
MNDTTALFYAIGIYLVFLFAIFWNYGMFTSTMLLWTRKIDAIQHSKKPIKKLSTGDKLKCYIPFYQACLVHKSVYRSYGPFQIMSIFSAVGILWNLFNKFVYAINGYVMFFSSILMIICLIMFFLVYAIITADIARMYGFSWFTVALCFLFPHLACTYLHNNIPTKMKAMVKEETFSEHNGNTYIKQRHN